VDNVHILTRTATIYKILIIQLFVMIIQIQIMQTSIVTFLKLHFYEHNCYVEYKTRLTSKLRCSCNLCPETYYKRGMVPLTTSGLEMEVINMYCREASSSTFQHIMTYFGILACIKPTEFSICLPIVKLKIKKNTCICTEASGNYQHATMTSTNNL